MHRKMHQQLKDTHLAEMRICRPILTLKNGYRFPRDLRGKIIFDRSNPRRAQKNICINRPRHFSPVVGLTIVYYVKISFSAKNYPCRIGRGGVYACSLCIKPENGLFLLS